MRVPTPSPSPRAQQPRDLGVPRGARQIDRGTPARGETPDPAPWVRRTARRFRARPRVRPRLQEPLHHLRLPLARGDVQRRVSVRVHRLEVRAARRERFRAPPVRGGVERRAPAAVARIRRRARRQHRLRRPPVPALRRGEQGRPAVRQFSHVRVRAAGEKRLDRPSVQRDVERRRAVDVERVGIGARAEHRRQALRVSARGGVVQRRRAAVVPRVRVRALAGEQELDDSPVALVRGVVQRAVAEGARRVGVLSGANQASALPDVPALRRLAQGGRASDDGRGRDERGRNRGVVSGSAAGIVRVGGGGGAGAGGIVRAGGGGCVGGHGRAPTGGGSRGGTRGARDRGGVVDEVGAASADGALADAAAAQARVDDVLRGGGRGDARRGELGVAHPPAVDVVRPALLVEVRARARVVVVPGRGVVHPPGRRGRAGRHRPAEATSAGRSAPAGGGRHPAEWRRGGHRCSTFRLLIIVVPQKADHDATTR